MRSVVPATLIHLAAAVAAVLLAACGTPAPQSATEADIQRAVAATASAVGAPRVVAPGPTAQAAAAGATPRPTVLPATATAAAEQVLAQLKSATEKWLARDFEGALRDATRVIELAPNYAHGYNIRALTLAALGRYDQALQDAERAVRLEPSFPTVDTRAWVNLKRRRYQEALADYERLAALGPEVQRSPFLLLGRGVALAGLGQVAPARADVEAGLRAVDETQRQTSLPPDPQLEDLIAEGRRILGSAGQRR